MKIRYIIGFIVAFALVGSGVTTLIVQGINTTTESPDPESDNSTLNTESNDIEITLPEKNTTDNFTPKQLDDDGFPELINIDTDLIKITDPVSGNLTPNFPSVNFTSDSGSAGDR